MKGFIMERDHRQPWYLFEQKDAVSGTELRKVDSDLLIAIDKNDVQSVGGSIAKDNIDINKIYKIPSLEVPEADKPQFETFLHRALYLNSSDVFKLLLKNGANPRIENYRHLTVLEDLFDSNMPQESILKYGKMLVDAGVTAEEITLAAEKRSKKKKQTAKMLIDYAKTGKIASQQKEINLSLEHIKN